MKTKLLLITMLLIASLGYSQCDVVNAIDENFDGWSEIDQCWASLTEGAMVYPEENSITYYSLFSPNTNTMLVTPEIEAGTYTLLFDATVNDSGSTTTGIQMQVGTLTDNTATSTFVAVGDPIDLTTTTTTYAVEITVEAGQYIALNATIPAVHSALYVDNVVLGKCLAPSIDESFEGWSAIDECWETLTEGAMVYSDENEDFVTFYSLFSPNTNTMLVTPQIVAGSYTLNFNAAVGSGSSTTSGLQIQVGKVTSNSDASTFTALGDAFNLTTTDTDYSLDVTLSEGEYLVFNAVIPTAHAAIFLNSVDLAPQTLSSSKNEFSKLEIALYPNPSRGIVNLSFGNALMSNNASQISVYNITGRKVFEKELTSTRNALDLSNLSAGSYILQINSGNSKAVKKLILN